MLLSDIRNHVVVVGDTASGLALTTARMAAERGATVVIACRDVQTAKEQVKRIRRAGGKASFLPVDITRPEGVEAVAKQVVRRYGRIDAWVNSAGVGPLFRRLSWRSMWVWLRTFPLVTTHLEFQGALRN